MREELLKMTKYKEQYKFLHKNKILNKSDLDAYAKSVRDKLDNLIAGKDAFYEAKKPLTKHFNNITLLSALEGPHEMYIEGYYEMKEEHDAYIKAKEELAKAGYGDDLALKELYSIKVEMYENITKSWEAIHACKAELKMCEQVEKSSEDIKTKLNELKKGDGKDEPGRGRPSI